MGKSSKMRRTARDCQGGMLKATNIGANTSTEETLGTLGTLVAVTTRVGVEKSGVIAQNTDVIVPGVLLNEGMGNLVGVKDGADVTIKKASRREYVVNKTHMSH